MELLDLCALMVSVAALFAWINHRTLRLPPTLGVMAISLVFSLVLLGLGRVGLAPIGWLEAFRALDFAPALLQGMLGFLLFAGALHVDLNELRAQGRVIGLLATVGVLLSTVLVALGAHFVFGAVGLSLPWIYCFLFGAIVSPTDPIAVLAILKQTQIPPSLKLKISGESLFNDGVGVVVFLALLAAASGGLDAGLEGAPELLAREVLGGLLLGLVLGGVVYRMLRSVDGYAVEVLLTLALVSGGYALAQQLHTSGPLAMVTAGLLIGNQGRRFAMSDETRGHLDSFWELIDEMLNAVLFVMIGLEVLLLPFTAERVAAGLLVIPIVVGARFLAVGAGVGLLRRVRSFTPHAVTVLSWGGIRGGISVALALTLPAGPERDLVVPVTYTVVAFSILVQGLSIGPLVRRLFREGDASG